MRFKLIDAAKEELPVQRLCKVLGVSPSGYFAWRSRPASRRQREDLVLLAHVRSAFALSNGTYGSPRLTRELQDSGLAVGRRRTARLMRENGLRARQPRRFKRTTDRRHAVPVAPNLIAPDVSTERPDEKGGADLSSIGTREGWLSLAGVMDLFARRGVGWAVSDRLHKEGGSPPCAEPWSCDDQRLVCFIIRTVRVSWPAVPGRPDPHSDRPARVAGAARRLGAV